MSLSQWIYGFMGILFVRFIFELLSSPARKNTILFNPITLVHYGLFWITLTLGLIIIVGFFSKNYLSTSKIALFGLPIIWLAPIFDIIISRGNGYTQSYIFDNGYKLIFDFFTFFGSNLKWGATYGIRIEMLIVLIGVGWYLRKSEIRWIKTFAGIFSVYILGFIMASWPGILYTISHINAEIGTLPDIFNPNGTLPQIYNFFGQAVFQSTISHNTLYEGMSSVSTSRFFELGFDKLSSQILFIVSCFLTNLLFWKIDKKKFIAVIKNIRLERIGSYLALLLCGMGFAYINGLSSHFVWSDIFGVVCLFISWISLWMYAVHENDIADVAIDEISNKERPLIKRDLAKKEMQETGYIWLVIAILGAFCAGFYPFFMSLVYIFSSHIYSSPPLRLRRFPLIPSFLIGVASLATILAGFFFISVDKNPETFPIILAVGIVVMVTLAINVKDMKDIEGDRVNGIMTLPVIFEKNGPKVVGLCFALSFLLFPFFLSFYFLYIISIPAAIIGYRLVIKKPYSEKPIFILRFTFLLCVGIVYIGILWLVNTMLLQ
ncbi:MAG: UbiA family prenyltransferase [Minisyncoccia bacterium]